MASGTVVPEVERVLSSPLDARVLRLLQRPGAHLKRGDPVVELDVSESVLALEKVVKDLKIKDNQQAQTRLALEKSLVDLDGRIEVKTLRAAVGAGAARRRPAAVQGRAALARGAAADRSSAVKQAQIELAQLRDERKNAERATERAARGARRSSAARSTRRRRRRGACSTSRPRNPIATAC